MQISALLGITNPQVEVPSNGAPAGFEMLIAQLLAAAGGPEPPGAPPGVAIPCGEKLTTPEPNALSIQPDSAADAQNANFAFAMALAQTDLAGSIPISPVPPSVASAEPIVEIAPDVLLSKSAASLDERAALVKLLDNPDLGITRIAVDRDVTKGIDVIVPRNAGEEITTSVDAIVPRNAERESTKGADAIVSPNAGEETTRRGGAVVPRHSEARNSDPTVSSNAQGESAKDVDAIVPRNAEEQTSKGADPVVPRNADNESTKRAGAVVPRNVEGELSEVGDAIVSSDGESTETPQRGFRESSQERSNSENPHQPKPILIEAAAPIAKATPSTKIESIDRPAPAHELVRALADRIETALATRLQERITIEFRPLDLGDIKVILTQQNDQVEAQIVTDNERVRQAVHAVQAELRQSLEQRGVQLGAFSVSDFSSHQEPNRQNPSHPQSQPMPMSRELVPKAAPVRPTYAPARATGVDLSI
ncbi:MAG: flagellar hook-length control protein FliK [Methanoregulaceae archaeon]|nr:flagellar hook-length control protein FliK [Methanoregulaceae archaeon]